MISKLILIIILISSILFVFINNRFSILLFFSLYSIIIAFSYMYFEAPDVAISEIVIGACFIPLVVSGGMSNQLQFDVYYRDYDKDIKNKMQKYCDSKDLKHHKVSHDDAQNYEANGVLSNINIDVVVMKNMDRFIIEIHPNSLVHKEIEKFFFDRDDVDIVEMEILDVKNN